MHVIERVASGCLKRGVSIKAEEKYEGVGPVRKRVIEFRDTKTGNAITVPDRMIDDATEGNVLFLTNYILKKIKT